MLSLYAPDILESKQVDLFGRLASLRSQFRFLQLSNLQEANRGPVCTLVFWVNLSPHL